MAKKNTTRKPRRKIEVEQHFNQMINDAVGVTPVIA
jgi:hypothetical protein